MILLNPSSENPLLYTEKWTTSIHPGLPCQDFDDTPWTSIVLASSPREEEAWVFFGQV